MAATLLTTRENNLLVNPKQREEASQLLDSLGAHPERLLSPQGTRPTKVPSELANLLARVLEIVANGGTVTIGSLPEELSTTTAAEQLGISRPTLMKLIRSGEIVAHKVGSHHRLKTADVAAFRRRRLEEQSQALRDLDDLLEGLDQS